MHAGGDDRSPLAGLSVLSCSFNGTVNNIILALFLSYCGEQFSVVL